MKPSRDEIAAAIRAADIGGPGSTVDHEEAAENVLALLSQAGGSEAMKARCKKAVAFWRGEVERLQAENERLRKVENDALWLARLACSSSWPMDMAQQVENAAERVKAAFSGSSGEVKER